MSGLYRRLAVSGMRRNRQLYVPYLLSASGLVMMYYIMAYLVESPARYGDTSRLLLRLGCVVTAVFSGVFLFYTNSFLIRRRRREFGLYTVLGMTKANVARVLAWEALFSCLIALGAGLLGGVLFSKAAELILLRLEDRTAEFSLYVSPAGLLEAVGIFTLFFALLLIVSLVRVRLSSPLELLNSESEGEKPPRANWFSAVLGAVVLAAAYAIALSVRDPMTAIPMFFFAVLLVVAGTYLLFRAGSVALCRALQKDRRYYYRPEHFVSVSGMVYRMRRNGVGLASICILATMVLVMLSSTGALFLGGDDSIRAENPYDAVMTYEFSSSEYCRRENYEGMNEALRESAGDAAQNVTWYDSVSLSGYLEEGGYLRIENGNVWSSADLAALEHARVLILMPLEDYNRLSGRDVALAPDEAMLWSSDGVGPYETFTVGVLERTFRIAETISELPLREAATYDTSMARRAICLVIDDWVSCADPLAAAMRSEHSYDGQLTQTFCFDLPGVSPERQIEIVEETARLQQERLDLEDPVYSFWSFRSWADSRETFRDLYGGFFFLGVLLSVVFVSAAVTIIYYKQVSEGYEDAGRFAILRKVGMTDREIRRSVNSQVRTVFLAPLLLAGIHLCFAFPMIRKLIGLLGVANLPLLLGITAACYLLFGVIYALVYFATSHVYAQIVSGAERQAV